MIKRVDSFVHPLAFSLSISDAAAVIDQHFDHFSIFFRQIGDFRPQRVQVLTGAFPGQYVVGTDLQYAAQVDEIIDANGLVAALQVRDHLNGDVHHLRKLLLRVAELLAAALYALPDGEQFTFVHSITP